VRSITMPSVLRSRTRDSPRQSARRGSWRTVPPIARTTRRRERCVRCVIPTTSTLTSTTSTTARSWKGEACPDPHGGGAGARYPVGQRREDRPGLRPPNAWFEDVRRLRLRPGVRAWPRLGERRPGMGRRYGWGDEPGLDRDRLRPPMATHVLPGRLRPPRRQRREQHLPEQREQL